MDQPALSHHHSLGSTWMLARMGGMSPGSIGELKYSAQSHQLANVSIIRTRIAGLMALKLLENGMPFKVRTNLKGFKKICDETRPYPE